MRVDEWWKNFGMGLELDASGTFLYNGIKHLHNIERLNNSIDIFEVLYNLSVGIERLQKITIVLLEHDTDLDIEDLEESLITHNTLEMSERINKIQDLKLSNVHREFLSLLVKFYKTHRYGRYSMSSVPDIESEKELFLEFISKHLKLDFSDYKATGFAISNSDQIRKFLGNIVKKISSGLYKIITKRAHELNIYTYELRSDSKAMKVFLGERLDFIEEDKIRREILLFLMHPSSKSDHIDMIRNYDPLPLDPGLAPAYIKSLVKDHAENFGYISGEVEELYYGVKNVGERFQFLEIMDDELLLF